MKICEKMRKLFIALAQIAPKCYWKHFKQQLIYAGETTEVEIYLGRTTLVSLLFALIVLFFPYGLRIEFSMLYPVLALFTFLLIQFLFYLLIYFKVEDRARRVEEFLPDALQLISTNLQTGMTPFKALRLAARKEFGPLYGEIRFATSKAFGTESFSDSLQTIGKRVKSETLQRALDLFTTAMRAGGHLSKLLDDLAKDIEENRSLKKELVTNTKTSVSFIMFSVIIGAPLLLTISIEFLKFMVDLKAKTGTMTGGFGMGMLAGEILITPDFMFGLSVAILIFTSILASILLGVLTEGKINYGFKYAPAVAIGSFLVFLIMRYVVGNFFAGIL